MNRRNALKATALTVSSLFLGKTAILEASLVNPVAFFKHELDAGALMDFFILVSDRLGITMVETNPDPAKDVTTIIIKCMDDIAITESQAILLKEGILQFDKLCEECAHANKFNHKEMTINRILKEYPTNKTLRPSFELIKLIDEQIIMKTMEILGRQ